MNGDGPSQFNRIMNKGAQNLFFNFFGCIVDFVANVLPLVFLNFNRFVFFWKMYKNLFY